MSVVKGSIRSLGSIHRPLGPDVFLFSTPRSGSTWLVELISTQPGFKCCDEPLNLRDYLVRRRLGIESWEELCNRNAFKELEPYFNRLHSGRLKFRDPVPFRNGWRPVTERIVYKILHGGEAFIREFEESFEARIVFLIRHPIAVTLSRKVFPRLQVFVNSDYASYLTEAELSYTRRALEGGSDFQRGMLSWCIQNSIALRHLTSSCLTVTYEQLVLEPEVVVPHLVTHLSLPQPDRCMARLATPSASSKKSSEHTREYLKERTPAEDRRWLVEKWQRRVGGEEVRIGNEMLRLFGLDDLYICSDAIPGECLWLNKNTPVRDPL